MSNYVGLSVLHPGGFKATEELAGACKIDKSTRVIDIACGKGTTAVYLAEKYGCKVVGIDILEDMIEEARKLAEKKRVSHLIEFRVGDALNLPFDDNEFDVAFSQAMLILVEDKLKAVEEAVRVIKPGGFAGWVELSWKAEPPDDFISEATDDVSASCMRNVDTFEDWRKLFKQVELKNLEVRKKSFEFSGMKGMMADEGLPKTISVMLNYMTNKRLRARMKRLNEFILSNPEYFGYGIYICQK
jgi:SAM-dependent methyltransferase